MHCLEQGFEGRSAEVSTSLQLFCIAPPSSFGPPVTLLTDFFVNLPLSLEDLKLQIFFSLEVLKFKDIGYIQDTSKILTSFSLLSNSCGFTESP